MSVAMEKTEGGGYWEGLTDWKADLSPPPLPFS